MHDESETHESLRQDKHAPYATVLIPHPAVSGGQSRGMIRTSTLLRRTVLRYVRAFAAEAAPEQENVLQRVLSSQLSDIRTAGTYKTELELVSPQGPAVRVAGVEGEVLNFCALPTSSPPSAAELRQNSCAQENQYLQRSARHAATR